MRMFPRPALALLALLSLLGACLEVSDRELSQWLRGEDKPPEPIFLRAVEVVLLHAGTGGRT